MSKRWLTRGLCVLGLFGVTTLNAHALYVENENVQNTNANPSPGQVESQVNNYINQDEQINVQPTDGVVKVLRTDQKNLINDFLSAVVPIYNAHPREIRNVIRRIVATEGGRAEVIVDKVTGQKFVQVIAPRYMIPYLRDAIAALDVDWLKEYWDGATDIYVKPQHRDAADIDAIAQFWASDEGFTQIDTTNNAIRRYDDDYRTKEYVKAVGMVDIPTNQVLLDVKIYEVNANNDTKLGLDYINWRNGPGRNLWSFIVAGYSAEQRAKGLTSVFDPFIDARTTVAGDDTRRVIDTAAVESYRAVNYLLTSNYVDFLQAKGKARVLNSQQLMVVSANTATITAENQVLSIVNNVGDLDTVSPDKDPLVITRSNSGVLYVDKDGDGEIDKDETPLLDRDFDSESPEEVVIEDQERRLNYRRAGTVSTSLEVTPYVGLKSMELELNLQVGELNGFAPSGLPIINTRTMATTVRLLDGQPYAIAGLKRSQDTRSSAKVPFLGSIPVLGYLFGGETNLKRDNDIVVVITPTFYLSSQVRIATPPRVKTMEALASGVTPLGLPEAKLGYDQWLLGNL